MPAASPGVVASFFSPTVLPEHEAYIEALVACDASEYEAIARRA